MSAANCFVTDFYYLAAEKGLDADELLLTAEIDQSEIDIPTHRIASEKLARMVVSVWDQLQDESMGLSTSPLPRGAFSMLGKIAVGEARLHEALLSGGELYRLITDAYQVVLDVGEEDAILSFEMSSPQQNKYYLFAEITLLAWHRLASWLILENIVLKNIYFDYSSPAHVAEYSYLLPGKHIFDSGRLGFSFSKAFLQKEICQTRETLKSFVQNCPMELFVQPRQDYSISGVLKKMLQRDLAQGQLRIDQAADALHLSRRTLIRKLREEGTSYQSLKDLVRRDKAIYLLKRHNVPISDIAAAVGFSDPAVFSRAFRGWTGFSPRTFRAETD